MTFYHGTTLANWKKIKTEGVLWGIRNAPCRVTYLAVDEEEARQYGKVILEVEYDPTQGINNYQEGCWQLRVYDPIPLTQITRL